MGKSVDAPRKVSSKEEGGARVTQRWLLALLCSTHHATHGGAIQADPDPPVYLPLSSKKVPLS